MPELTVNGRQTAYLSAGEGPGRPVLFVHGFTGSKEDFEPVVHELAARRHAVALDLPGHGGSEGPEDAGEYSLGLLASWVLAAADALGLDDLHLVGHSLGGLIAQRAALLASERLRSLVLVGSGLGALREEAAERAARVAVAARDRGMEAAWEENRRVAAARGINPDSGDPGRDAFVQRRFLDLQPAAVVGAARALVNAVPAGAFLRGIDIPVLVVHGEDDDAWLPSEQRLLADTVQGAGLAVISKAGHTPQLENTTAFVEVLAGFLERADGAAPDITRPAGG